MVLSSRGAETDGFDRTLDLACRHAIFELGDLSKGLAIGRDLQNPFLQHVAATAGQGLASQDADLFRRLRLGKGHGQGIACLDFAIVPIDGFGVAIEDVFRGVLLVLAQPGGGDRRQETDWTDPPGNDPR